VTDFNFSRIAPGCTGKRQFANKGEARQTLLRHRHITVLAGRGKVHPYHCDHCGHWHIGSAAVKPRKGQV
jgi:hypothetical protein